MLHAMERKGYLTCREERNGRTVRKWYCATAYGKEGLALAKLRVQELTGKSKASKAKAAPGGRFNDAGRASRQRA